MLTYPNIDPIAFSVGPISIRWYGISYLFGFGLAYAWCLYRSQKVTPTWDSEAILDLFFYTALGVIFGGTIGYLLFYEPSRLLDHPLDLLKFWEPGRSFHGGLLGVICALFIFSRVHHRHPVAVGDFLAPCVPLGLACGRIGNFLNAELWGRVTDVPWGMVFPQAGVLPRHPSQLYEFFLEGLLLFGIVAWYSRKPRPLGSVSGLFLIGYGIFRAIVEFLRDPASSHGWAFEGWLTMGQALSIPMILGGAYLLFCYGKPCRLFCRKVEVK